MYVQRFPPIGIIQVVPDGETPWRGCESHGYTHVHTHIRICIYICGVNPTIPPPPVFIRLCQTVSRPLVARLWKPWLHVHAYIYIYEFVYIYMCVGGWVGVYVRCRVRVHVTC